MFRASSGQLSLVSFVLAEQARAPRRLFRPGRLPIAGISIAFPIRSTGPRLALRDGRRRARARVCTLAPVLPGWAVKHQRHIAGIVTVLASVGLVLRVASPVVVLFLLAPLPILKDHTMSGFEHVTRLQEWALTPIVVGEGPFPRGQ